MKMLTFLLISVISTAAKASSPCLEMPYSLRESLMETSNFAPQFEGALNRRLGTQEGLAKEIKFMSEAGQVLPPQALNTFWELDRDNRTQTSQLERSFNEKAARAQHKSRNLVACVEQNHQSQCLHQANEAKTLFENYIEYVQANMKRVQQADGHFEVFVQGVQQAANAGVTVSAPVCDSLISYARKESEIQRERVRNEDEFRLVRSIDLSLGAVGECLRGL